MRLLCWSMVAALLALSSFAEPPVSAVITADEYEVYAAAIRAVSSFSAVVLDSTATKAMGSALDFPELQSSEAPASPVTLGELHEDFRAKNKSSVRLAQRFPSGTTVRLITEAEFDAFFSGCKGSEAECRWEGFRAKYGREGITRLSRAGFNKSRDVAVIYISNVHDFEAGTGEYMIFRKEKGEWKLISQIRAWIA